MAYLAYGLAIESDLALGVPTDQLTADVVISAATAAVDQERVTWFERTFDDWCFGGRLGSDYYLLFEDEAEFVISADGSTIRWFSFADVSATLIHLLLDHVLPRALVRSGSAALHGSCLGYGADSCFAIVGRSGRGKSTLAAALVGHGHQFMADDCVIIDMIDGAPTARPAYPELRLGDDSLAMAGFDGLVVTGDVTREGVKQRHAVPEFDAKPGSEGRRSIPDRKRLTTIFVLSDGHSSASNGGSPSGPGSVISGSGPGSVASNIVSPEALSPANAAIKLLSNSFQLNDIDEQAAALAKAAEITAACELRFLAYDHSADGLRLAIEAIEQYFGLSS